MAWYDVVLGVATGGLYNIGKTIYEASEAAGKAGDAIDEIADQAGNALAVIGAAVGELLSELTDFTGELQELITIERITPRDEDALWDEEVVRLNALRQRETELLNALAALGEDVPDSPMDAFLDMMQGDAGAMDAWKKKIKILAKLSLVRTAIKEILYEEPGVVPAALYNIKEILERFNTLEQPRIEGILDSLDDNLEEGVEILEEVKKLFVVRTWKQVAAADMAPSVAAKVERMKARMTRYDQLIARNETIIDLLGSEMLAYHPSASSMENLSLRSRRDMKPPISGGSVSEERPPGASRVPTTRSANQPDVRLSPDHFEKLTVSATASRAKALIAQPMGHKVGTLINRSETTAYLDNYNVTQGRMRLYERERLKLEKAVYRLEWIAVDEPGAIPKTLEEVRQIAQNFRVATQPRLDQILDNVAAATSETTSALTSVNATLQSVNDGIAVIKKYATIIKIALAVSGGLTVGILFFGLIALFRVALGI